MADEGVKKMSKREQYIAKMKARRPDAKWDSDDPEDRYGAFDDYDNDRESALGRYKESDNKMKEYFMKDPKMASMLSESMEKGSMSPSTFAKYYGKDLLTMSDDTEELERVEKANQEYLARVADSENLRKEQESNLEMTMENLQKFSVGKKMSEDDAAKFLDEVYNVVESCLKGSISVELFEMFYKGIKHDDDVKSAVEVGVAEGRNQKIDKTMKRNLGDGLPELGSRSSGKKTKKAPVFNRKHDMYS